MSRASAGCIKLQYHGAQLPETTDLGADVHVRWSTKTNRPLCKRGSSFQTFRELKCLSLPGERRNSGGGCPKWGCRGEGRRFPQAVTLRVASAKCRSFLNPTVRGDVGQPRLCLDPQRAVGTLGRTRQRPGPFEMGRGPLNRVDRRRQEPH